MYNSYEERALIQAVSSNHVGAGRGRRRRLGDPASDRAPDASARSSSMRDRFAIYVGRIDENKGCAELFEFFEHYSAGLVDGMHLVLIGTPLIADPGAPADSSSRLRRRSGQVRRDRRRRAADHAVLSREPVDGRARGLGAGQAGAGQRASATCCKGQCLRSNAGLFYENYQEFAETLRAIDTTPSLQAALGRNGRAFFERHYAGR